MFNCVVIADWISLIFVVLTIAVYLYVEKLRNVLGKCIVSNLCCLLIHTLKTTLFIALLPTHFTCCFNIIMFVLTAYYIIKVKREINRFKVQEETTVTCLNIDSQTYLQFVRISVLMGGAYIFSAIFNFISQSYFYEPLYLVAIFINRCYGVFVFFMLIPRRSTLSMLVDR
ncbi:probable G-protein coupled receptor Mth-like 7 [Drosophila elegans]|uniref:probable G-protein coupled receptor Mth-like 7 n=1 Tax=Drosophila elegans TaxID=30023 RepID=UPI0007E603C6|nr:probable G-protein coupled receptor Mth-like 7 [Drosophila elegans]